MRHCHFRAGRLTTRPDDVAAVQNDLFMNVCGGTVSYLLLAAPFGLHPQSERRLDAMFPLTTEIHRGAARPSSGSAIQRGCLRSVT
jgi:hypothetical protein